MLIVLALIGGLVVAWHGGWFLAEILRAAYWAVWEIIPQAKANPERVTFRRVVKHLWHGFWNELTEDFHYESRSCKYYTHAYWPWQQPREWHL